MNNKKGYTLIEVIVSILVLSIASIMLLSGIKSVIHFMSASNNLKNASDAMFGKAEGIEDETITGKVSETSSEKIAYKVNGLPVEGYVKAFQSEQYKDISLKQLFDKAGEKLNTKPIYTVNAIGAANNFYKYTNDNLDSYCNGDYHGCMVNYFGRNDSIRQLENNLNYKYSEFPLALLPNSLQIKYYIRVNYPWEYGDGRAPLTSSGGSLIFLSLIESHSKAETSLPDSSPLEKINFVYDYVNQIWYYHPDNAQGQGLSYQLQYKRPVIEDASNSNVIVSDQTLIKSWEEFYKHIKNPKNGWYFLDGNTTYEMGADPSKYWVPVK